MVIRRNESITKYKPSVYLYKHFAIVLPSSVVHFWNEEARVDDTGFIFFDPFRAKKTVRGEFKREDKPSEEFKSNLKSFIIEVLFGNDPNIEVKVCPNQDDFCGIFSVMEQVWQGEFDAFVENRNNGEPLFRLMLIGDAEPSRRGDKLHVKFFPKLIGAEPLSKWRA